MTMSSSHGRDISRPCDGFHCDTAKTIAKPCLNAKAPLKDPRRDAKKASILASLRVTSRIAISELQYSTDVLSDSRYHGRLVSAAPYFGRLPTCAAAAR